MKKSKKMCRAERWVRKLKSRGEKGMTFSEIQEFFWKLAHPDLPYTRAQRGFFCTNLYGSFRPGEEGLLRMWTKPNPEKGARYVYNGRPIEGPFYYDKTRKAERDRKVREINAYHDQVRQNMSQEFWRKVEN